MNASTYQKARRDLANAIARRCLNIDEIAKAREDVELAMQYYRTQLERAADKLTGNEFKI